MVFVSLGINCAMPDALKLAHLREQAYPFDWFITPSNVAYDFIEILLNKGVTAVIAEIFNISKYQLCQHLSNNTNIFVFDNSGNKFINSENGFANIHFKFDSELEEKLTRRFDRLLNLITNNQKIVFLYCDNSNDINTYTVNNVVFGNDASDYLERLYSLIYQINKNIEIIYFCRKDRQPTSKNIRYVYFNDNKDRFSLSKILSEKLISLYQ